LITFDSWHRISCSNIEAIKTTIITYGPVDAAVEVTSAFMAYENSIYEDPKDICSGVFCYYTQTDHAIALVGWDDNNGEGYWILRNSWGQNWGHNGYMRIKYDSAAVSCAVAYLVPGNWTRALATAAALVIAKMATLEGTIFPSGKATTYYFEYGTTSTYGSSTQPEPAGAAVSDESVSTSLAVLNAGTQYHFRICAVNATGISYGADMTLTTVASPSQDDSGGGGSAKCFVETAL
jgi:hypothetical protein